MCLEIVVGKRTIRNRVSIRGVICSKKGTVDEIIISGVNGSGVDVSGWVG